MKSITPHSRAFFIKNETNVRLCSWIDHKLYYITIPFIECKLLKKAADILKDCGIIDGYEQKTISKDHFDISLFQYRHHVHFDSKGREMIASIKTAIDWHDLDLTRSDVQAFTAHFVFKCGAAQMTTSKEETPVIHMPPHNNNNNQKRA